MCLLDIFTVLKGYKGFQTALEISYERRRSIRFYDKAMAVHHNISFPKDKYLPMLNLCFFFLFKSVFPSYTHCVVSR